MSNIKNMLRIKLQEIEKLKGGLADGKTIQDIADKHNVGLSQLKQELARGIKHELEHINNKNTAKEIAMDHLWENPKYYTKLKRLKLDENEVALLGDIPNLNFSVKIKGRLAGKININKAVPELGDDTVEIIGLEMAEGYNDLDSSIKAVRHIWTALPEIQRLVVTVNPDNQVLWEKIGFTRLNNQFWILTRGH